MAAACPCGSCAVPCYERPMTCPDHGANCEPDDHVTPPTVNGEVV